MFSADPSHPQRCDTKLNLIYQVLINDDHTSQCLTVEAKSADKSENMPSKEPGRRYRSSLFFCLGGVISGVMRGLKCQERCVVSLLKC